MGMCKGCNQIFKTEEMTNNFCIDCQKTDKYIDYMKKIENGDFKEEELKDKSFFYKLIWTILLPIVVILIYIKNYHFALIVSIFPILGTLAYIEEKYALFKLRKNKINKDNKKANFLNKKNISKILIIISIVWFMFTLAGTRAYLGRNIDEFILVNIPTVIILMSIILFKTYKD